MRERRAADLDGCVAVLRAVHRVDGYPVNWPAEPGRWLTPPGLLQAWVVEGPDGDVVGHVVLQRVVGQVALRPRAEVSRLFVAAAARRRSVASELLGRAVRWADDHGYEVVLQVVDDRRSAVAFYLRTGWRHTHASADFGRFAADHDVFVIPTLTVLRGFCGYRPGEDLLHRMGRPPVALRPADPSRHHLYGAATEALRQLVAAGVPVLAGTDTSLPTAALGVFGYGATLHAELDLLVDGGCSPTGALIAATSAPARAFRLPDRGFVRPGLRADLVLVDGDPTGDIRATRNVVAVWKRGVRIHPGTAEQQL